jgi:chromosome partitioning protein
MELVGVSEIAELAGVSRQAVSNWRSRSKNFPSPLAELSSGPVWLKENIENWLKNKDGKMTKVVSFINLKGGVGKTTTTVAIAEFLALEHQKRVLVVDLDPQTNATIALIDESVWEERDNAGLTLLQMFRDKLDRTNKFDVNQAIIQGVSNLKIPRLSLLPSSLGLIELQDYYLHGLTQKNPAVNKDNILKSALKPVLDNYDYVLIDCPPNLQFITTNGINVSTGYVIPTIPDILSTYGIPQILDRIETFANENGIDIQPIGIIISKMREIGLHRSKYEQLKREAADGKKPPIFDRVIDESARIAESADVTSNVNTLRQKYGYGNNYANYASLTEEFIWRCQ